VPIHKREESALSRGKAAIERSSGNFELLVFPKLWLDSHARSMEWSIVMETDRECRGPTIRICATELLRRPCRGEVGAGGAAVRYRSPLGGQLGAVDCVTTWNAPRASKAESAARDSMLTGISCCRSSKPKPDMAIEKMQHRLLDERRMTAGFGTMWTFLDRCRFSFKKKTVHARTGSPGFPETA
jgi:hypothetical protein